MEVPMTAIEMTGTVDENHQVKLDGALPSRDRIEVKFAGEPRMGRTEMTVFISYRAK